MRVECLQDPFSSGMGWGRCRLPGRRAPSGSQSRGWRPLASWYVLIGNHVRTVFRSKKNRSLRTTRQGRDRCFSVKGGLGPTQMVPFEVLPRWPFRGLMLLTGRLYVCRAPVAFHGINSGEQATSWPRDFIAATLTGSWRSVLNGEAGPFVQQ